MDDRQYMQMAIDLAQQGCGWTAPNPMVGAVIVKDGRIIGQGLHEKYGQPHAERNALANCTENPEGATMYVTLEPCCHYGKQPPCTEAIIDAGIKKVFVGSADPNPKVAGKGIQILRDHGIEVEEDLMREECDRVNEVFLHFIQTKRPFVAMKYAMTMDGKIAAYTGDSKWVTGETARAHVQNLRNRYTGIMVGVGTVLADDPMLNCRMEGGKDPIRIICDTNLRTPLNAKVVQTAGEYPTIIATCCKDEAKLKSYEGAGCRLMVLTEKDGHVNLTELMEKLGEEKIDSILLEGGGTLNWAALEEGIVRKVYTYIAPKLFGGQTAKTPVEGIGVASPSDAVILANSRIQMLGDDFLIESDVKN